MAHTAREHHYDARAASLNRVAFSATAHCLTGCAIGEVLGMVVGTALGWGNAATIALAVALAFLFGYALTMLPLLRAGLAPGAALRVALAADSVSITIMEVVDNAIMLVIPGAMAAGPASPLFWGSLAVALLIAGAAAFPVNRWLISRGRGHALVHERHARHRPSEGTDLVKPATTLLLAAALVAVAGASGATEYEPDEGTEGHVPAVTYELHMLRPGEAVDPEIVRTDLDYTEMMRRHHEGAVTMSEDYLADPRGTNPVLRKLARAIIANQRFEIAVLDGIRRSVGRPPATVLDLGFVRIVGRETGVDGLEHLRAFVPWPAPGRLDFALRPGLEASEFDVEFAKGMILHHQAAVDMAREYNADPKARNRVIGLMNLDIIVDQAYEIGVLREVIDRFPGDPDAVAPAPALGMPMDHSGHGATEGMASPGAAGGMHHGHGDAGG